MTDTGVVWNFNEIWNEDARVGIKYVILLLNQPVSREEEFVSLWNAAEIRISVDGGGNRWHAVHQNHSSLLYPTIASGDFDSIRKDILDNFKDNGVSIISTPDQDETDFTKALRVMKEKMTSNQQQNLNEDVKVIGFCENGGRLDQIFANVETLFHAMNILPGSQVYLMGFNSISCLLTPGSHRLLCHGMTVPHCALIPIGSSSTVTTTGLKWNLDNGKLAFGHLVSTSNKLAPDNKQMEVIVKASDPVLWWMEIGDGEET